MRTSNGSGSCAPKRLRGVDGTGVSTVIRSLVSALSTAHRPYGRVGDPIAKEGGTAEELSASVPYRDGGFLLCLARCDPYMREPADGNRRYS